jgi:rubrerythrin
MEEYLLYLLYLLASQCVTLFFGRAAELIKREAELLQKLEDVSHCQISLRANVALFGDRYGALLVWMCFVCGCLFVRELYIYWNIM